jgi:hypothetical protein
VQCLFLDLASHAGLLACVTDDTVQVSVDVDRRLGDLELVPLAEGLLQRAGWVWKDLTHIACVVGPGGFMSLRVEVAFANTVADQLQIPSVGIHGSDLFAARLLPPVHPSPGMGEGTGVRALWLHSTKKLELFVRGFGELSQQWPDAKHLTLEEFQSSVGDPPQAYWMGELIPEHHAIVDAIGMSPLPLRPLLDVLPALLASALFEQKLLLPWYGREG